MSLPKFTAEKFGGGWRIEFEGPQAPRQPIKTISDTELMDVLEEHLERLRAHKAAPPVIEPIPPIPTNFAPPVTRRSRTWAAKKAQETSHEPS